MNRRSMLINSGKAAAGVAACAAGVKASPQSQTVTFRVGSTKEDIGRLGPMVVTHCGHAACEISLPESSHHPDWQFTRRVLTAYEQSLFRAEYGRSNWLLTAAQFGALEVRGFILNGRHPGWNLSVQTQLGEA